MLWMVVVALALIGLTWMYTQAMPLPFMTENFVGGRRSNIQELDGMAPDSEHAALHRGPLLDNVLTVESGLGALTAASCYAQDRAVTMQLGGQYTQRTNNYQRDYPDNCSAPKTEFVDSVYKPRDGIGLTVPCEGDC